MSKKIIIAITGASGTIYAKTLLEILQTVDIEVHLIVSQSAKITANIELGEIKPLEEMAACVYANDDLAAAVSSGSFLHDGMIVIPCSIKTLSSIAYSMTDNLIARAADVTLKERRKLVLAVRESPFHLGHLKAMCTVTEMGAVVAPPIPAFYTNPSSIEEIVRHSCYRVLDLLGVHMAGAKRWNGNTQV